MRFDFSILVLPIGFTVISICRLVLFQHKLLKYLRENHTEKWKELTTIGGSGPGYANSIRGKKFLFDKCDLDDPEVLRLKVIVRNSYIYALTGFLGTFLFFCIIVMLNGK